MSVTKLSLESSHKWQKAQRWSKWPITAITKVDTAYIYIGEPAPSFSAADPPIIYFPLFSVALQPDPVSKTAPTEHQQKGGGGTMTTAKQERGTQEPYGP